MTLFAREYAEIDRSNFTYFYEPFVQDDAASI